MGDFGTVTGDVVVCLQAFSSAGPVTHPKSEMGALLVGIKEVGPGRGGGFRPARQWEQKSRSWELLKTHARLPPHLEIHRKSL